MFPASASLLLTLVGMQVWDAGPPASTSQEALSDQTRTVLGQVVDNKGLPIQGVPVFAVRKGGSSVVARMGSGPDGRFSMVLSDRLHDFGVMSPRWLVSGHQTLGPTSVRITVREAFPGTDPVAIASKTQRFVPMVVREGQKVAAPHERGSLLTYGAAIGTVTGRVTDEAGHPLPGVRVLSADAHTRRLVSVAETNQRGEYWLVTKVGLNRLLVHAPGMSVGDARRSGGKMDFVLAVDANVENAVGRTGRVFSFKLNDSVYPAIVPPPEVMVTLLFDYKIDVNWRCFCPGNLEGRMPPTKPESMAGCRNGSGICANPQNCSATVWERQCKLPKFWWLRLLQVTPPAPGSPDLLWWEPAILEMQRADAEADKQGGTQKR